MPDHLKYLVVDDNEIDRAGIEIQADKFSFLKKVAACSHPVEAAEMMEFLQPDIVFADIEMPDMSGLQLIKMFLGKPILPVFITSHPEFAVDSYEIEAFDYLLKPLSAERFARCAFRLRDFCQLRSKAFAFEKEQEQDCIIIKQGHEKYKLRLQEIIYLEAMKDYTRIFMSNKQYLVLATLTSMQAKLPPEKFMRIHRSYVVNVEKIQGVKEKKIFLPGFELPQGKLYKNALKGLF